MHSIGGDGMGTRVASPFQLKNRLEENHGGDIFICR